MIGRGTKQLQIKLKKLAVKEMEEDNTNDDLTEMDEDVLLDTGEPSGTEIWEMLKAIRTDTSSTNKSLSSYIKETDKKLAGMSSSIDKNL